MSELAGAFGCGDDAGAHPRSEPLPNLGGCGGGGLIFGFGEADGDDSGVGVVASRSACSWAHGLTIAPTESLGKGLTWVTYAPTISPMTTTAAIGTCLWAGHKIRAEVKPAQELTPCPECEPVNGQRSMVRWHKLVARVTDTKCDGACRSAKSDSAPVSAADTITAYRLGGRRDHRAPHACCQGTRGAAVSDVSGVRAVDRAEADAARRIRYRRAIRWTDVAGNWDESFAVDRCMALADAEVAAAVRAVAAPTEGERDES